MGRERTYGLLLVALFTIAVAVRSIPLFHSGLPTPHAFGYVPPVIEIVETGRLSIVGRTDHQLWHTWLAQLSLLFAVEPVSLLRPISAVIGALPVVLAGAVTRRLGAYWGWQSRRIWTAAGLAGLFIGIQGLYLYRSMAPHPNTIGLFVLPLFVISLHRAYTSRRRSWWIAAGGLFVIVPPVHVFVSLVTAIIVTILAGVEVVRSNVRRRSLTLVGVAGLLWLYVPGFHFGLRYLTATEVAYTDRVTGAPGLLAAWVILGVIGTIWWVDARPRTQRWLGWAIFGGLFSLVAVNAVTPVFFGAPATPPVMLLAFAPLAVLVFIAIWRLPDLTRATRVGPPLVAIIAGTLVIGGFTLTAPPTIAYLTTAERANYFLHFPVMVLAGMGGAVLLARIGTPHRGRLRAGVTIGLVLCAAASIPIALAGVPILPYENTTDGAQLSATQFAMEHVDGEWTSDGHLRDIATRIGGMSVAPPSTVPARVAIQPTLQWMRGGPPPDCAMMLKHSWMEGAHFYPQSPERISPDAYAGQLESAQVVFASGATDELHLTVPRTGESTGC